MNKIKTMAMSVGAVALLASTMAASAQDADYAPRARRMHHVRQDDAYRPLTVGRTQERDAYVPEGGYAPSYNPYAGPGAIVTGPVAFGATLASLPFRLINSVFPARGNTPLVVVGAPVHFAGQIVQAPFAIAEAPFGGPGPFNDPSF